MKKYLLIFSLLIISLSIEASNYYWVGGTGNWSDFSNHWATTSGGSVFHVQIPTPADNVYFDANSFAGSGNTVYVDTTAIYCKDMNWTGATGSPTFTTSSASSVYSIQIYGSLTLTNNMTWYFNGSVNFESTTPGNTIKTNGVALNGNYTAKVYFNGVNGSWALQDSITATAIQVNSGATFHTNNYKVNCNSLGSAYGFTNNGRTTLGTSSVNCYYFSSYSRLIDADSSIINVTQGFQGADSIVYNKVNMGCSTCFPSIGPLHFCSFNQINAQGNAFNFYGSANDVNLLASSAPTTFFSGINHFTRADFTNDVTFSDSTHFDTLNFNNPGEIITLAAGKVQFVSSVLNLSGTCTGYTTVHSSSLSGVQASIYKNGAAVVSNYILLKDVNASGTSFTANNSIDNGNNTGWTINTASARSLYWVGNTGNWSDPANWALTSGGTGGNCQPTQNDNVYFDINSFASSGDIVYIDQPIVYCKNMDWTGTTGSPAFLTSTLSISYQVKIYGSLILPPHLTNYINGSFSFESTATGNTIKTNGTVIDADLVFEGVNGSWNALDSISSRDITIKPGATFNTNNNAINCSPGSSLGFLNQGRANLGTSILNCTNFNNYTHSMDADSAVINVSYGFNTQDSLAYNKVNMGCPTCTPNMNAASCSFNKISASGLALNFYGSANDISFLVSSAPTTLYTGINNFTRADFTNNVTLSDTTYFDTLNFNNVGKVITLGAGKVQFVNSVLNLSGSCSAYTTLKSTSISGVRGTINKTGSAVVADYLILKDIAATGTSFTANNSIDNGNNLGWAISGPAARNLYWVGNTNNWSNPASWALTSGGAGGNCPPTQNDNVYFDANSFVSAGDVVTVDSSIIYCNNMDWTGATGNPSFNTPSGSTTYSFQLFGSLALVNGMTWNFNGDINFESTAPGNTIKTNGVILNGNYTSRLVFDGVNGTWDLQDSLSTAGMQVNTAATFKTNNNGMNCSTSGSSFGLVNNGTLKLGTSTISCYNFTTNSHLADADSAILNISAGFSTADSMTYNKINLGCGTCFSSLYAMHCSFNKLNVSGSSFNFNGSANDISFLATAAPATILGGVNNFTYADFMDNVTLSDSTYFDTLYFNDPGKNVILGSGTVQYVANDLQINGSGGFPVTLKSSSAGTQATISKSSDTVCVNFLYLQDIKATGGAVFYAGANSFDLGDNPGWSFTSCWEPLKNVWPGDANYDLVADNLDILNIGLAYGETGFVRPGATILWQPEPCLAWSTQFSDGTNTNNADCDGNGLVDANDTLAVSANYSLVHPAMAPHNTNDRNVLNLYIDFSSASVNSGDMVSVPVKLGTAISPASNVYGIAFSVNYNSALIESGAISTDYVGSWLVTPTNKIHLEKNFPSFGQLDIGVSRINHLNQSGNGTIATLNFQASTINQGNLIFSLNNILAVDNTGAPITITPVADTLSILTGIQNLSDLSSLSIYPNPASDYLNVDYTSKENGNSEIQISDPQGRIIKTIAHTELKQGENHIKIETSDLKPGVYVFKIKTQHNDITKRFVVVK